jgi:predicted oxidoreductase
VVIVDQEPEQSLGGQAFWSFGGLFLVDSPEQRRMGIRDSYDLAREDWMGSAGFDRAEDHWPRQWAEAYLAFAAGEKRSWLYDQGLRFFPVVGRSATGPVEAFKKHGVDFVVKRDLAELVRGMNALTAEPLIELAALEHEIVARDRAVDNPFSKDSQITHIRGARHYRGDRLIRTAAPHKLLDPKAGPLIAVRLHVLTRKTLGGLETDLSSRVLGADGLPVPGLYAAGEVAGFGGGGMHGYSALEGTFLGGCLFSGRTAGRAAAKAIV